ncbi:iron-binding CDGSH zinc finger protein [Shimia abyssi]|uniref:Iron-binding CDGSH zinc finger protein n=2 Tax=Shimia abyssi TaxID=1662395 RepID=A0A2P8FDD1_9RHOB|nr:iron-binding CDGSH zinc finger protein [Shimia abyssi]
MPPETRVLYNADCPICDAEICHYARYTGARDIPVRYDDLNTDARLEWGIDPETAARRLHVLHGNELHVGLDAFRILWWQMPRYRPLAWLTGLPGVYHVASATYDKLLAPWLFHRHLKRKQKHPAGPRQTTDQPPLAPLTLILSHPTKKETSMHDAPIIAQKSPIPVEVEAGKSYFWCACGQSSKQPFCDGSHKDTGFTPVKYTAEDSKKVFFCGCKHSANQPTCDGTHSKLG